MVNSTWTKIGIAGAAVGLMLLAAAAIGGSTGTVLALGVPQEPTATNTQGPAHTHTPSPAPTEAPTEAPDTPTPAPDTPVPAATATPSGDTVGGGVQPPATGTGSGSAGSTTNTLPLIALGAALLALGGGAALVGARRR